MKRGLPKAREGLLTTDHSRRGRRCVTVLDPETLIVTVLESWEHAVLVLCDGTRGARAIVSLLGDIDGFVADEPAVKGVLEFFARQDLVEYPQSQPTPRFASARPQSIAALQQAYAEWHKDPVRTSQILSAQVETPFESDPMTRASAGTAPGGTVPLEGSVQLARSVIDDSASAELSPTTQEIDNPIVTASFSDEPTENREPAPREETELMPVAVRQTRTATPRAATLPMPRSAQADEREIVETLMLGEAGPHVRCRLCLAEIPRVAKICPACRNRL